MGQTQTKWTFSRLMWLYGLNPKDARKTHAEKHTALLVALRAYLGVIEPNARVDRNAAQVTLLAKSQAGDEFNEAAIVLALLENRPFRQALANLAAQWEVVRFSRTTLRDDRFEEFLDRASPDQYQELRSAWVDVHSAMEPILANPAPTSSLTL